MFERVRLFNRSLKILRLFLLLVIFIIIGCAEKVVYVRIPLSNPPERYEIGTITNSEQELLEYTKAIFTIGRWQNWYNSQVKSNYYNYYNYSNYLYNKKQ